MYDVIIIGGSYSGLAAAMTMGRSIRKTLVIDSGKPCNAQTPHSHNFITQDGAAPSHISTLAKEQVLEYPTVSFKNDEVTNVEGSDGNFEVSTLSQNRYKTEKLIFATGVKDLMPAIEGFADCWGITAIHCPYCHGYEVKSKNTGIFVNDESAADFAKLILNWTGDLTIYSNGTAVFDKEEVSKLGVYVVEEEISLIQHKNGYMTQLDFKDGTSADIDALYHRTKYEQHCKIPEQLGCELTETGHIQVNDFQQTNVPGIYAVGDATTPFRAVSIANASGAKAAFILNHELITQQYQ
ncbi:NAD(P)/FAD-dependent oxidoreductase [Ulvibacterium sp.]|uniref:NAD(P)/FAD-dependent oxidoreductase n=1 Tax=Ulvibacterium sp. TaxID=2665914 RepID=UPI0026168588|nr:NAD(P)/FAD-dependent oxidoreductase [Ulvibacterium sp.]